MSRMKALLGDTPYQPQTLARRTDPHTSHRAAELIAPKIKPLQQKVLAVLRLNDDGLTDYEIEDYYRDHGSTYRTRRAELVDLGIVIDTGKTRIIKGRARKVWAIGADRVEA